jgi:hypothetical protein
MAAHKMSGIAGQDRWPRPAYQASRPTADH